MSIQKATGTVSNAASSSNAYTSVASSTPSMRSDVVAQKGFAFGKTSGVQGNINALSSKANMRASNVVMKAHPDSFMPEFAVKGSGAIPLQKNFQDNNFGAGRTKTIVKMGDGSSTYTVTLKTPEGDQTIECADDVYIIDAAEE